MNEQKGLKRWFRLYAFLTTLFQSGRVALIAFFGSYFCLRMLCKFIFPWYGDNYPPTPVQYVAQNRAIEAAVALSSLAIMLLAVARSLRRGSPVEEHPRCGICDYNLTGNTSGVCPECGTAVNSGRVSASPGASAGSGELGKE